MPAATESRPLLGKGKGRGSEARGAGAGAKPATIPIAARKNRGETCVHFQRGTCTYGNNCRFIHEFHRGSVASGRTAVLGERGTLVQTLRGDRPKVRYMWQLPQAAAPEVIFVGQSNAGKSTLLNSLMSIDGALQAAPVSGRGGRTRSLNWYPFALGRPIGWYPNGQIFEIADNFDGEAEAAAARGLSVPSTVGAAFLSFARPSDPDAEGAEGTGGGTEAVAGGGKGLCLVDSFGMGTVDYVLKAKRLQSWAPLMQSFMSKRKSLQSIFHLVSAERGGRFNVGDRQLIEVAQAAVRYRASRDLPPLRYVAVLTKVDILDGFGADSAENGVEVLRQGFASIGLDVDEVISCTTLETSVAEENGEDAEPVLGTVKIARERLPGVEDVLRILNGTAERGWAALEHWDEERSLMPALPEKMETRPSMSREDQKIRKNALRFSRVADGKNIRGGLGSGTELPQRV